MVALEEVRNLDFAIIAANIFGMFPGICYVFLFLFCILFYLLGHNLVNDFLIILFIYLFF